MAKTTDTKQEKPDVVDSTRPRAMPGEPERPKARPTIGFLILLFSLTTYAFIAAALGDLIVTWPLIVQTLYYVVAGIAWIFPAVRILRWALTNPDA